MKKPKKFEKKKLSLNKDLIANLNQAQMEQIRGGGTACVVHTCGDCCCGNTCTCSGTLYCPTAACTVTCG